MLAVVNRKDIKPEHLNRAFHIAAIEHQRRADKLGFHAASYGNFVAIKDMQDLNYIFYGMPMRY